MVFEATRITETNISCLDHIHSNFVTSSTSGSIAAEIADHLPALCTIQSVAPFLTQLKLEILKNLTIFLFKIR